MTLREHLLCLLEVFLISALGAAIGLGIMYLLVGCGPLYPPQARPTERDCRDSYYECLDGAETQDGLDACLDAYRACTGLR